MKQFSLILCFCTVFLSNILAQSQLSVMDYATGGQIVSSSQSPINVFYNPISSKTEYKHKLSTSFVRNFNLAELQDFTFACLCHFEKMSDVNLGFGIHQYGNSYFKQLNLATAISKDWKQFSFGVNVGLSQNRIPKLKTHSNVHLRFGSEYRFDDKLSVQSLVELWNWSNSSPNQKLDNKLVGVGFKYGISEQLQLRVEKVVFGLNYDEFRTGFQFWVIPKKIWLAGGYNTLNKIKTFGLGFKSASFQFCFSYGIHQVLAPSIGSEVQWELR